MRLGVLTLVLTLTALNGFVQAQTARIMPLGNSITAGIGSTGDDTGYRKPLWQLLNPSYSVNFVGSQQGGDGTFDEDHEGHPGWKSTQIRDNISVWVSQYQPDFILLHIGTNDISARRAIQDIINDIDATLTRIWNYNRDIRVFLCSIIPRLDSYNGDTQALNSEIVKLVNRRKQDNYPINHVDQYSVITGVSNWQNTLMSDYLHPNDTGYQLMAEAFYDALKPYLTPVTPVELVAFTGNYIKGTVVLEWQTASESNNLGFSVEHAFGNEEFEEIGFVQGNGTTTIPQQYSFVHRPVRSGVHRYRLKQVDFNGTFEYSNVVEILVQPPATFALSRTYPNPFMISRDASTRFQLNSPESMEIEISVFDLQGRLIKRIFTGSVSAGSPSFSWDGKDSAGRTVAAGMYFIRAHSRAGTTVQRLQVLR